MTTIVLKRRVADRTWAFFAALGLFATAAFVILVIHPGGFEGQIGWAYALMPGYFIALPLADHVASPTGERLVLLSSIIVISFLWYLSISYALIKGYRFLASVLS